MKVWGRRVVIGLILWLAILAGLSWLEALRANQQPQQHQSGGSPQSNIDPRTADDRIADYTLWLERLTGLLAISSIGLWYVTWKTLAHAKADSARQARQTRVGNLAAIKAANAATASAEAARKSAIASDKLTAISIGIELPILRIVKTSTVNDGTFGADRRAWLEAFTPTFEIRNFGRTPAFVDNISVHHCSDMPLPIPPKYKPTSNLASLLVIESGKTETFTKYDLGKNFTVAEIDTHSAPDNKGPMGFYGKITYTDILGNVHEQGWVVLWVPANGQFITLTDIRSYNEHIQREN